MRGLRSELGTFFWLQWKLTRSMFRVRGASEWMRVLGLISRVLMFLFTFPMALAMGGGLAVGLILLSPGAAYEVAMIVNCGLFFLWLILPVSYSSQLMERFELSRLFSYPIRFSSLVVGSTLTSMLTMTGLWSVPILLGEVVGLAWHQPLALPLIGLGVLPTLALLVLTGRIMDDVFDLVAGDRRLRALALFMLSLPMMVCWLGQYVVQYATQEYTRLPQWLQVPFLPNLEALGQVSGPSEFLEMLSLSRVLIWLPPGWATAGMGLAATGAWGRALAWLGISIALVALLLRVHAGIVRRLMQGAALRMGAERVRSRRWSVALPGAPAFWALFRKDWIYLWRSPMPRRLLFSTLIVVVAMLVPSREMAQSDAPLEIRQALPMLSFVFVVTMTSMVLNMGLAANYYGVVDREGFVTLALSGVDRRYVILSSTLAVLLFEGGLHLLMAAGFAVVTGVWAMLPLGLYLALCLQVGGMPAYTLAAIVGPYRAQLKFAGGRQRGNAWGLLAWVISAPPVLALIVLPYVLWKPGLLLTLPLAAVYSVGLYVITLQPLARLLQRREYAILQAVGVEE